MLLFPFSIFSDQRSLKIENENNSMTTLKFYRTLNLQGVDAMSEVLLEDMSLVDHVKSLGLVMFVWGEANNDADTINIFKEKGVDAIIYDRYDIHVF